MRNNRPNRKKQDLNFLSDINITPFVDVMLVLLIIFMVTSSMIQADLDIDLPEADAKPTSQNQSSVVVSVYSNGKIYIGNTQVNLYNLATKVKAINNNKQDSQIFIKGDKTANYGIIIQVIAELNKAGFNKVALVTEPK